MSQQEQITINVEEQSAEQSVDVRREQTLASLGQTAGSQLELIMTPDGITTKKTAAVDRYGTEERTNVGH